MRQFYWQNAELLRAAGESSRARRPDSLARWPLIFTAI